MEKDHPWFLHACPPMGPSVTTLSILPCIALYVSPLDCEHLRAGITPNSSLGPQCLVWHVGCRRFSVSECYMNENWMSEWIIKGRTWLFLDSTTNLEEWVKEWEGELGLCEEDNDWMFGESPRTKNGLFSCCSPLLSLLLTSITVRSGTVNTVSVWFNVIFLLLHAVLNTQCSWF